MAHRIYVYNIDSQTGDRYSHYLGEWNYEIPELLFPLFSCDPRSKGKLLYFDKINGVARLKSFFQLIGEHYQLLYKKAYYEPVNKMFDLLDALPYDTFLVDAWDVFNMNEESHTSQAKDWVLEIKEKSKLYDRAIAKGNLGWLEKEVFAGRGYETFLAMLETDWINYGLGYWNEELYKNPLDIFEENNLCGLKDKKGNIIIPAIYDEIFAFTDEGIAVIKKDGKFGYMRNDGKVLVECIYDEAYDNLFIDDKAYAIIEVDHNTKFMTDVFVISDENGWGIYNASEDRWLIPISKEYKKIECCREEIFRVLTSGGMHYYDQKTEILSDLYDYIGEGVDYYEQKVTLYKGNNMFILDNEKIMHQVTDRQLGAFYEKRYNLRGKDQKYFLDFYKAWIERKGSNYEEYFDDKTLMSRAEEYSKEGNIKEAIRLYTIGVKRGNADMMVELGYIYTNEDQPEFYDVKKGIALYEKAASQDNGIAWNNLGYHYQNGIGYPHDIKKALKCFRKGIELREGLAMQNMGLLYFYGDYVLQDYDLALEYYKQAEKKFYFNEDKISEIYYQKRDFENLQRYLKKDKVNTYSNIYFGIMYEEGLGVKQSTKKAIKHFEKALEYSTYHHALQRVLYYYKEDPAFANPEKYEYWKSYGKENDMDA